jgi:hypothetical protein
VIPAEVIAALAVTEQTDDESLFENHTDAFDEVLSHYGLKRDEAYRYSVSSAKTLDPMRSYDRPIDRELAFGQRHANLRHDG